MCNLRQIGLAIDLFRKAHHGHYPTSFGQTFADERIGADAFVCPSTDVVTSNGPTTRAVVADLDAGVGGGHCSYVYAGGGLTDKTVQDATVVAYEPLANHGGAGGNVLYGDGHAGWVDTADWAKVVATARPAVVGR